MLVWLPVVISNSLRFRKATGRSHRSRTTCSKASALSGSQGNSTPVVMPACAAAVMLFT